MANSTDIDAFKMVKEFIAVVTNNNNIYYLFPKIEWLDMPLGEYLRQIFLSQKRNNIFFFYFGRL